MAAPSATELYTQLTNICDLIINYRDGQTLLTDIDAFTQDLESEFSSLMLQATETIKADAASALNGGTALLESWFFAFAYHVAGRQAASFDDAYRATYEYMIDATHTVKRRGYTRGTPTADGGNTGDGTMYQLDTDQYGQPIESTITENVTARVIRDASSGGRLGAETFEVFGEPASRSGLDVVGSGVRITPQAKSERDSLVKNPSFSSFTIAGTLTTSYDLVSGDSVASWDIGDVTQMRLRKGAAEIYRPVSGDTAQVALEWKGNTSLAQTFETAQLRLDRLVPVDLLVPLKPRDVGGMPDGTLAWRFGALTGSIDEASVLTSDGVWYPRRLLTAAASNHWPRNFLKTSQANLTFSITRSGATVGYVAIDAVTLVTWDLFARRWVIFHAGETPFVLEDEFTQSDSISSDAKVQRVLAERLGLYLPSTTGTPTVTEPT